LGAAFSSSSAGLGLRPGSFGGLAGVMGMVKLMVLFLVGLNAVAGEIGG